MSVTSQPCLCAALQCSTVIDMAICSYAVMQCSLHCWLSAIIRTLCLISEVICQTNIHDVDNKLNKISVTMLGPESAKISN